MLSRLDNAIRFRKTFGKVPRRECGLEMLSKGREDLPSQRVSHSVVRLRAFRGRSREKGKAKEPTVAALRGLPLPAVCRTTTLE